MMLMCPGVWPGVGNVVSSPVMLNSPSISSTSPMSTRGHTQSGALG